MADVKTPKPIPDYSSPADEQRRERTAQDERREALERYNESTFGESHSFASVFLRMAICVAIVAAPAFLLPGRPGRLVASLLLVVFVLWESRKGSRTNNGWVYLRDPWRRWW